ncbi:MAG: head completion/stabilization protein [Phenylobacterium sp.]|nr:head completion/stabilization protein [Phenylobacterium sp.]
MSGFVSRPPSADTLPPPTVPPEVITSDGWWPDIDMAKLRQVAKLDTNITPERLRDAAIAAMIELNGELEAWRAPHDAAGAANLHAVEAPQIDGESRYVHLYTRALYSAVAADLSERLADVMATTAGLDRAAELGVTVDQHRRAQRWAIRTFLGLPHNTVELI